MRYLALLRECAACITVDIVSLCRNVIVVIRLTLDWLESRTKLLGSIRCQYAFLSPVKVNILVSCCSMLFICVISIIKYQL